MISAMGDLEGKGKGGFVLLDEDFKVYIFSLSLSSLTLPTRRIPIPNTAAVLLPKSSFGLELTMQVKGQWSDTTTEYGYDFW